MCWIVSKLFLAGFSKTFSRCHRWFQSAQLPQVLCQEIIKVPKPHLFLWIWFILMSPIMFKVFFNKKTFESMVFQGLWIMFLGAMNQQVTRFQSPQIRNPWNPGLKLTHFECRNAKAIYYSNNWRHFQHHKQMHICRIVSFN